MIHSDDHHTKVFRHPHFWIQRPNDSILNDAENGRRLRTVFLQKLLDLPTSDAGIDLGKRFHRLVGDGLIQPLPLFAACV